MRGFAALHIATAGMCRWGAPQLLPCALVASIDEGGEGSTLSDVLGEISAMLQPESVELRKQCKVDFRAWSVVVEGIVCSQEGRRTGRNKLCPTLPMLLPAAVLRLRVAPFVGMA